MRSAPAPGITWPARAFDRRRRGLDLELARVLRAAYRRAMAQVPSFLRVAFGLLVLAVSATVCFTIAILLLPSRIARIKLGNYYGKFIGRTVVWLSGAKLEIFNKERLDGSFPAIYIANHASTLDAFISIWLCPVGGCGVMKKEVAKVPFFGWAYLLSGHLRLDRSKHAKAVASLTEVGELVKKNPVSYTHLTLPTIYSV